MFEIRPYQEKDPAATRELHALMKSYFPEIGCDWDDTIYNNIFQTIDLETAAGCPLLIAYADGVPAGFASGLIDAPGLHWCKRPGWGCICEFYIIPAFRRQGLGSQLCGAILEQLKTLSPELPGFYLTGEPTAVPFWERCGFSRTGSLCPSNDEEILEIRLPGRQDRFFHKGETYLQLNCDGVFLRDMVAADLEDYERWNTTETEWQQWDGPWARTTPFDKAVYRKKLEPYYREPLPYPRENFEICLADGTHVGSICSYTLDGNPAKLAIGIDIYACSARQKGIGTQALAAYIRYLLRECPGKELYTQTWSGNSRMIGLAEKCRFEECRRIPGLREVRGASYDGLTFRLNVSAFREKFPEIN